MDVTIGTGRVRATIQLAGAMTTAVFNAGSEDEFSPSYIAKWSGWEGDPLLEKLRGDFLCVPFGAAPASAQTLPEEWRGGYDGPSEWTHGYSASGPWELLSQNTESVRLGLTYPESSPVERVERLITCEDDGVEYIDTIIMRQTADLPLGLHPILRLPETPGGARLVLPKARSFHSLPIDSGTSVLKVGAIYEDAAAAPRADGGTLDLTRLPLDGENVDEIVLMVEPADPKVTLVNEVEGYEVSIEWDPKFLEHCLLWVSNRGRTAQPWGGTNLCLGVEPVTSAFDFGQGVSAGPNPLNAEGIATSVHLEAGERYEIRHRMTGKRI
ncbi:hypothetical protein G7Y41_09755 [Schaalia sp. ZJ405]|uniref:hypothetical protein n=1 Tax=Schaalia sp. ZJ405 TaxID=2709403 RepID=UPI0013ED5804|nr:hypothetical protein [Schaalia sp. ZJ405]QPK81282.1 hypothetical protein G7Y41_09755 [Schaalia sp. ZJ405]